MIRSGKRPPSVLDFLIVAATCNPFTRSSQRRWRCTWSRPEFVPTHTLPSWFIFRFQIAFELSPLKLLELSSSPTLTLPEATHLVRLNLKILSLMTAHKDPSGPKAKSPKLGPAPRPALCVVGIGTCEPLRSSRRSPVSSDNHISPSGSSCRKAPLDVGGETYWLSSNLDSFFRRKSSAPDGAFTQTVPSRSTRTAAGNPPG